MNSETGHKSPWMPRLRRLLRIFAPAARFKDLYAAEHERHLHAQESVERGIALHQQDRERLARNADALTMAADKARAASSLLDTLERELREIAFLVDRDLRYRFHTHGFAVWARAAAIDGDLLDVPLRPQFAAALKAPLADALHGKPGRIELDDDSPGSTGKRLAVAFVPHYGLPQEVTGVLVRIAEIGLVATPAAAGIAAAIHAGSAAYVETLATELTGWDDPQSRIREAILHDGFDLHVQDIIALREGIAPARMQEVLIRMQDEEKNQIPPGAFLPVAERFGLMADFDRYVLVKALAARRTARSVLPGGAPVLCINLSLATIQDGSFADFVASSLEHAGVAAESLCFEFEDSDVLVALPDASRQARALQKLGCRRSLDGFGATRVAFDHLKAVPIDYLKIDGRIIFEITRDSVAVAKVKAIQRVCNIIGVRTIAQQVESEATLVVLRQLGVHYVQGFGIDRPRPFPAPETRSVMTRAPQQASVL